jgi:hypothetical protein
MLKTLDSAGIQKIRNNIRQELKKDVLKDLIKEEMNLDNQNVEVYKDEGKWLEI